MRFILSLTYIKIRVIFFHSVVNYYAINLITKPKIDKCHLIVWILNHHFVFCILIFLVFLIFITAVIAAWHTILLIFGYICHICVNTLGIQGWQGPRKWIRFEIRNNHIPRARIAWFFSPFIPGQFLDCLRSEASLW